MCVVSRRGDGWRIKGQLGSVIVSLIERSTMIIFFSCFSFYPFPFEKHLANSSLYNLQKEVWEDANLRNKKSNDNNLPMLIY